MSLLEYCIWQKQSAADKTSFGLLGKLFNVLANFLLERHTENEKYYCALLSD